MKKKKSNCKRLGCTSAILVAIIVLSAFTMAITPASAQLASVTRDYSSIAVTPNEEFDVTLTQTNFFWGVGTVTEKLPEGFTYIEGSYTGGGSKYEVTYDPFTRELTAKKAFVNEADDMLDFVTYRVKASSFEQAAEFAGTFKTFVWLDGDSVKVEGDVSGKKRIGVDETEPYTEEYSPANGATGVSVDTNIVVHVKDNYAVDQNTILMTVDGDTPDPSDISKIPMTVEMDHWLVIYNPPVDFGYGETVFVTITATDYAGNAMPSPDFFSFTTAGPPDTTPPIWDTMVGIQSAADTGNGGEVTVTYGTATDADSPPVKYNVYYSTSSPATGGTKLSDVGPSPYTVTGLTNEQLYYFSVRAEDSAIPPNEDTNTVELTATPTAPAVPDTTPPTWDTMVGIQSAADTGNGGEVTVTYGTATDADSLPVKYNVYYSTSSPATGGTKLSDVGPSPYTVTGLTNGQLYYFSVRAEDSAAPPNEDTNTAELTATPTAPFSFTINFVTDYNMLSVPLDDPSITDAASLATKIGDKCTQISKWDAVNQEYVTYLPAIGIENFAVVGGEGYEVVMANPEAVTFGGNGWESPFTLSLLTDYNLIGIPVNDPSITDAASLATKIGDKCTQISKWDAVNQEYVTYLPAIGIVNSDVIGGEGYEVVMTGPEAVIFEGGAWSN